MKESKQDKNNDKKYATALLLMDMINDFSFPEAADLFEHAYPAAQNIQDLRKRAKEADIPVLYVNDNYGRWQSDFPGLITYCKENSNLGKKIADIITPDDDDFFILKPQFSGFYKTPLDLLLTHLSVENLILTGVAGNMCVHFTANDAYMRGYRLFVPKDCSASNSEKDNKEALSLMEHVLGADITTSKELDLKKLSN